VTYLKKMHIPFQATIIILSIPVGLIAQSIFNDAIVTLLIVSTFSLTSGFAYGVRSGYDLALDCLSGH
jgi:hydrogenase/urease accessory protein HupE